MSKEEMGRRGDGETGRKGDREKRGSPVPLGEGQGEEVPEAQPSIMKSQHLLEGGWMMEYRTGVSLAELLMSHIGGTEVEEVYIDEDEGGRYLGVVFTDGENEYHLTFEEDGTVQLAEGPLEGEKLEEVTTFSLTDVTPPFSEDGLTEG